MALLDIFDEISERQATKTELGEQRIFGAVIGIVAENYSDQMPGRLCVTIPARDESANQLKWAKMAFGYMGSGYGTYFIPEKNDQVVLIFEDGMIEKPLVIGCIPRDKDSFLKKAVTEKNTKKQIQTRNGSRITFEDDENEDGAKDKITVATAGDAHLFQIDNEKKMISMCDKEKNCMVEMSTEKGNITIHAEKKIEITVGDSITVILNGSNGSISIKADKLLTEAGKSVAVTTDGEVKVSGRQVGLDAVSTLEVSSTGMVLLKGDTVKVG